jgi:Domain of unknown function (DUF4868)
MLSLREVVDKLEKVVVDDIKMYFITRILKPDYKKRDKVLNKYDFEAYHVDVDDEIRAALFDYIKHQLSKIEQKGLEMQDYDVICDGTSRVLTYQLENKAMSFHNVVDKILRAGTGIHKLKRLVDLFNGRELWAYCVEITLEKANRVFTFTKISPAKVAIDPEQKSLAEKLVHPAKFVKACFDTNSAKLEIMKGENINLDKTIDCLFVGGTFFVFNKTNFERIIGLEEEFKKEALGVVEVLGKCELIEGLNLIQDEIEGNPSIHRKLAKLAKIGHHKNLDSKMVEAMAEYSQEISEEIGYVLKVKDGKIKIETKEDIDLLVKLLVDYFKNSKITGNVYGTYAGAIVRKGASV